MTWQTSLILLFIGMTFYFLYIALKGDNNQLPLKLIFITLSMGSLLFALNTGILIAEDAAESITDTSIEDSLVATLEGAYQIMLYVIWIFIAITTLSVLFTAGGMLKKLWR